MTETAASLHRDLKKRSSPQRATNATRFFKAGPGQYGEGDKFLGVIVPELRVLAKTYKYLPLHELEQLLKSPWHEERLISLFILVDQYKRGTEASRKALYDFYIAHTKYINNWDLVDSSAGYIVGAWLDGKPAKKTQLINLATSDLLWERRIAMVATFYYIRQGKAGEALMIANILLHDEHDLIQKAVGWMLREVGKRVDRNILVSFLDDHHNDMPRTALRYAIEHFSVQERAHYLGKVVK